MSGVLSGRVGKKRASRARRQVVRMMAIMQDGNSGEVPKEFLETGRTGRRNAMPDILSEPDARATTADLPARLQELATNEKGKGCQPQSVHEKLSKVRIGEMIELDLEKIEAMLNSSLCDPKNPQAGPSTTSGSSSDKDDAQKGSGS